MDDEKMETEKIQSVNYSLEEGESALVIRNNGTIETILPVSEDLEETANAGQMYLTVLSAILSNDPEKEQEFHSLIMAKADKLFF
jgi:hypothetical protein